MKTATAAAAVALLVAPLALADHDLKFPIVAMGEEGASDYEFQDFKAQVMDVNDGLTTYAVVCATDPCAGWSGKNDYTYTMVAAENTFEFRFEDKPVLSTFSACTFTGTPATAASCEMTNTGTIYTSTMGYEHHFTIPYTSTGTNTGNWELWAIQTATLRVVDGSAGTTPTSGSGGGTSPTPTSTPTGTAESGNSPSSTQSEGHAPLARATEWAVGLGVGIAAVAVGI